MWLWCQFKASLLIWKLTDRNIKQHRTWYHVNLKPTSSWSSLVNMVNDCDYGEIRHPPDKEWKTEAVHKHGRHQNISLERPDKATNLWCTEQHTESVWTRQTIAGSKGIERRKQRSSQWHQQPSTNEWLCQHSVYVSLKLYYEDAVSGPFALHSPVYMQPQPHAWSLL